MGQVNIAMDIFTNFCGRTSRRRCGKHGPRLRVSHWTNNNWFSLFTYLQIILILSLTIQVQGQSQRPCPSAPPKFPDFEKFFQDFHDKFPQFKKMLVEAKNKCSCNVTLIGPLSAFNSQTRCSVDKAVEPVCIIPTSPPTTTTTTQTTTSTTIPTTTTVILPPGLTSTTSSSIEGRTSLASTTPGGQLVTNATGGGDGFGGGGGVTPKTDSSQGLKEADTKMLLIVIGCLLGAFVVGLTTYMCYRSRSKEKTKKKQQDTTVYFINSDAFKQAGLQLDPNNSSMYEIPTTPDNFVNGAIVIPNVHLNGHLSNGNQKKLSQITNGTLPKDYSFHPEDIPRYGDPSRNRPPGAAFATIRKASMGTSKKNFANGGTLPRNFKLSTGPCKGRNAYMHPDGFHSASSTLHRNFTTMDRQMVGDEEHIYENPQVVIQGAYKKNPSRKSSAKGAHKNIQRTTSLPVDNYDYNEESPKLPKKAHSKESSNKSWLHSAGTPGTLPLSSPPDTVYQNTPPATPVRYDPPENSFQDSPTSSYPSTSSYNEFQYGEYEYTDDIPNREYQDFPEPPPEFRSPEIPDEEMDYNRTLPRDQLPDCFRYNTLGKVVQKDSDRLPYYNQDGDGFATLRDALKTQRRAARKASREAEPEEEDSGLFLWLSDSDSETESCV